MSASPAQPDRYAGSGRAFERRQRTLARGVASAIRVTQRPLPLTFTEARGAWLRDLDGNEYVDYALAYGPMVLGHSPAPVLEAVAKQLSEAITYGASHRLESELSEAICRTVPSAELCVFSNSGSEAVHAAVRIARAATGRRRVIKFLGHFHGWLDPLAVGNPGSREADPATAGQDPQASSSISVLPWNDLAALRAALTDEVAAVIMEPVAVNGGCFVADPGYLEAV
ncbi:MAG: aminotransferase class III-fold pyridoxal phosphate-dependent enzyme, partial [Actinomycetota bacterium]|nr:aminotransferase class III-fold pyridoxal phosphate-dependent enzyme [Actinomycetota bacterium]